MKKSLSLLLSIVMVLSLFSCLSVVSFAAQTTVESIDFDPACKTSAYEYTYAMASSYYDEETGKVRMRYLYDFFDLWEEGNVLTINYSDGTSEVYTCDGYDYYSDDGDWLDDDPLRAYAEGEDKEQWGIGTHYYVVSYNSVAVKVPVEIMESPVASVEFVSENTKDLIQDRDGYASYYFVGPNANRPYFAYIWEEFFDEGTQFNVTYKDGSTDVFTCDGSNYINEAGETMAMEDFMEVETQITDPWTEPGDYAFEFYYLGCKGEVPVKIVANNVKSVEYTPAATPQFIENTDGDYEKCDCETCVENGGEYFDYFVWGEFPCDGDKVTVTYENGDVCEYTAENGGFFDEFGQNANAGWYVDSYQDISHWGLGMHEVSGYFMGKEVKLNAEVVEIPVSSISISSDKPFEIYEETNGDWDLTYDDELGEEIVFFNYECPIFNEGVVLTVGYKDGTSKQFTYQECEEYTYWFVADDGEVYPFEITTTSDQTESPWEIGSHEFTVESMGAECQLAVEIVENPVESILFTPATPIVFNHEVDGDWGYAYDEDTYESYEAFLYDTSLVSPYEQGNKLTVNYTSGKTVVYTYSEDADDFVTASGEVLGDVNGIEYMDAQEVYPWTLENPQVNYLVVGYMGRYTVVRVVLDDGKKPEMAEISDWANDNGSINFVWDDVANASEYVVYRREAKSNGTWSAWVELATTHDSYYTDKNNIRENVKYQYIVHSRNSAGRSAYVSTKVITTQYVAPLKTFKVTNTDLGIAFDCGTTNGINAFYRMSEYSDEWEFIGSAYGNQTGLYDPYAESGVTYIYAVARVSGDYVSGFVMREITRLSQPVLKSAKNIVSGVQVSWNAVAGAESYNVYRKTANSSWSLVGKSTTTTYKDKTAKAGTTYTYTVRATANGSISSFNSKGVSVKCIEAPKISAVSNSANGMYMKWNKISGATSYRVYRKTANGSWQYVATTQNTYYTDTSVKNNSGTFYGYTVMAASGNTYSGYDNNPVMTKRLTAPQLKSVKNVKSGMQFTWGAVKGATSYRVYRKTANSEWTYLGNVTGTTYIDTTAKSGTSYTYTARAVYGKTLSSFESGITAKRLAEPQISGISNSNSGIYVKWGKVAGATQYRVYRKTSSSGWQLIATTKNTYYTDTSVKNNSGSDYIYTVMAQSGNTYSSYNKTVGAIKRLTAPVLKSAVRTSGGVKLTWNGVKGAQNYKVYRKTANGNWEFLGKVSATSFTDATAQKGTKYTYTVRACNDSYISAYNTTGLTVK